MVGGREKEERGQNGTTGSATEQPSAVTQGRLWRSFPTNSVSDAHQDCQANTPLTQRKETTSVRTTISTHEVHEEPSEY